MNPDDFRKIIREEVSLVIEEKVPSMIDEKITANNATLLGLMQEWFGNHFGILNEKIDLNQEKNDRNFAEIREDISHIKEVLDEHAMDIADLKGKKESESAHQSWRRS